MNTTTPPTRSTPTPGALDRVRVGARALAWRHPHFGLAWAKIKHLIRIDNSIETMAIDQWGRIYVNEAWFASVPQDRVPGLIAHELMHLLLEHAGRRAGRDPELWNVAGDMVINASLRADQLAIPEGGIFPPPDYSGAMTTDAIFDYLRQNPQSKPKPQTKQGAGQSGGPGQGSKSGQGQAGAKGQPKIGQGCGVRTDTPAPDAPGQGQGQGQDGQADGPVDVRKGADGAPDWGQVRREVQAMARQAGAGSHACARALDLPAVKTDWRRILRTGVQLATVKPGRDWQTFSKRNRRSPTIGIQLAGWASTDPRVAIIVDVSGSMARDWVAKIHAEALRIASQYPGARIYLIAHTDRVVWEGWIKQGQATKIGEALAYSGGTDPDPAYEALGRAGRFDVVIHFTDCEFGHWPTVPRRARLVVGQFGEGYCQPPPGARVIPCSTPE